MKKSTSEFKLLDSPWQHSNMQMSPEELYTSDIFRSTQVCNTVCKAVVTCLSQLSSWRDFLLSECKILFYQQFIAQNIIQNHHSRVNEYSSKYNLILQLFYGANLLKKLIRDSIKIVTWHSWSKTETTLWDYLNHKLVKYTAARRKRAAELRLVLKQLDRSI